MQACRVLRNPSALTVRRVHVNAAVPFLPPCPAHARSLTDIAVAEPHQLGQASTQDRVSALLRRTVSILPRTLSAANDAVGPDSSFFWRNVLEASLTEPSSASGQVPLRATITICGFNQWAYPHDLVTALLEDPLVHDPTYSEILRNRWKDAPSRVNIEYGKPAAFAGKLFSPSDWLQQFPHVVRLIEVPDLSSLSSTSDETDNLLLNSDALLLLFDPILTPLSDLTFRVMHLLNKPNTILVLTSGSASDSHLQFVSQTLSKMGCQPGHILFVDPGQALDAVTALQANPTSPSTIDRYQRETLGSRISTITVAINDILNPKKSETSLLNIRQETALSQVYASLSACSRSVEATQKDIDHVASELNNLSFRVQRIRDNARHNIVGKPGVDDKIERALAMGMRELNGVLASLTFWKMIWRVDDIGALVSTAVQGLWCKGLEDQLILQTGCLTFTQRELSISALSLLSTASSTALRSPVLENRLEQLKRSPTYALTSSSLTRPIYDRRRQLIQHTTTKLHKEAQSVVVGALGGALSGVGLGWWLAVGEHILSLGAGTEIGTAVGSGALLALGSIRWGVGKWERAKRRWAQDSLRIGEGLARDIEHTIQCTVDDNVTIIASTACEGMQDLVDRHRNGIHQLREELRDLDGELRACAQFPALWTERSLRSVKGAD